MPPLTWVSDIATVLQNGFTPVFADIDPRTLAMDAEAGARQAHRPDPRRLPHPRPGLRRPRRPRLLDELERRGIPLIEDVCESHGATHGGRKLGSVRLDVELHLLLRAPHEHHRGRDGVHRRRRPSTSSCACCAATAWCARAPTRPSGSVSGAASARTSTPTSSSPTRPTTSATPRSAAIMGRAQLKRLDANVEKRTENLHRFLGTLDPGAYRTDFTARGQQQLRLQPDPEGRRRRVRRARDGGDARDRRSSSAAAPPAAATSCASRTCAASSRPSHHLRVPERRARPLLRLLHRQLPRHPRRRDRCHLRHRQRGLRPR